MFFFFGHKYSRWSGWTHFFSCCHNYNKRRFEFFFLTVINTVINYINNKKNLIVFFFFVISIVGVRVGSFFSCYNNYNKKRVGFVFFYHKYNRWWDLFTFSLTMQWRRGATSFWQRWNFIILKLALQVDCSKALKSTVTNSFEIVISLSVWKVIF